MRDPRASTRESTSLIERRAFWVVIVFLLIMGTFGLVTFVEGTGDSLADDFIWQGNNSGIAQETQIPDCASTSNDKMQYDQSTNTWSCDSTAPGSSINTQEDDADTQAASELDYRNGLDRTFAAGEAVIDVDPTEFGAGWIDAVTDLTSGIRSGLDTTLVTGTAGASGNCAEWNADGDVVDAGAACGSGGGGDAVTVNSTAADTTANFLDGDIDWTLVDGGAGGPDDVTATVGCSDCVTMATETAGDFVNSVTAGDGVSSTGATSGENISHTLAVDPVVTGADADSATTQSDSGLEFVGNQLTMLRGCGDDQILKWDETEDDWNCEADSEGAGGSGDSITVDGNAIDTTAAFDSTGDVDFTFSDGGAGGPDGVTADINSDVIDSANISSITDSACVVAASDTDAEIKAIAYAEADGTDDDVQINDALDNCEWVLLSWGTFSVQDTDADGFAISLNQGNRLSGMGRMPFNADIANVGTEIELEAGLTDISVIGLASVEARYVSMDNFWVDGDGGNQLGTTSHGIHIDWTGSTVVNARRIAISHVGVWDVQTDGIFLDLPPGLGGGVADTDDTLVIGSGRYGLHLQAPDGVYVNHKSFNNTDDGIRLGNNTGNSEFVGGFSKNNTGDGIQATGGGNRTIFGAGFTVQDNQGHGAHIDRDDIAFVGALFDSNGQNGSASNVKVTSLGDDLYIGDSIFVERTGTPATDYHLDIDSGASNVRLVGGWRDENATLGDLNDNGTDTYIRLWGGYTGDVLNDTSHVFAGLPLNVQNTTDAASVQAAAFNGSDRATPLDDDEAYISFLAENDSNNQAEYVRVVWTAADVAAASKDAELDLQLQNGNAFRTFFLMRSSAAGVMESVVNNSSVDQDFIVRGDNDFNLLFVDAASDTVTVGSNVSLGKFTVDGDADEIQALIQGNATQTSDIFVVETSAGSDLLTVDNAGTVTVTDLSCTTCIDVSDETNLTAGDHLTLTDDDVDLDTEISATFGSLAIPSPSDTQDAFYQLKPSVAVTLSEISCSTDTGTVTIQFDERVETTPNAAGTDVLTSALVCDNDDQGSSAFDNAGIAANALLSLDIDATSGTPGVVRIHIHASKDD